MNYIVIMAGGTGMRLWPMSRKSTPKQLHKLVSDKTLIQETYGRAAKLVPDNHIFISTTPGYVDEIKRQLPKIPEKNYIVEPACRDTMASFGYILFAIEKMIKGKNSEVIISAIPSDHLIKDTEAFVRVFKAAYKAAEENPDQIVTVGINPTRPETGLGYIKIGEQIQEVDGEKIFTVEKFVEKPDPKTAEKYLQSWEYLWNTAYYFVTLSGALEWIKEKRPRAYQTFEKIEKEIDKGLTSETKRKISEYYSTIDVEPIANVVSEDQKKVLVIPADLGWSDIGGWETLHEVLSESYSATMISRGHHIDIGSSNCLIYGNDKMIATIGLKDVVIVDTPDAILIANKNKAQDVKKLLEKLKEEGKHLYL